MQLQFLPTSEVKTLCGQFYEDIGKMVPIIDHCAALVWLPTTCYLRLTQPVAVPGYCNVYKHLFNLPNQFCLLGTKNDVNLAENMTWLDLF